VGTTPDLFDYAGNGLNSVEVDPLGGGSDSYISWFTECTSCDYSDLHKYPLDEPEFTRKQDKVVSNSGNLDDTLPGAKLFVYPLAAPPKAIPRTSARSAARTGNSAARAGRPMASRWPGPKEGHLVGKLGDLSGTECAVSRKLVIKGGGSPDWARRSPESESRRRPRSAGYASRSSRAMISGACRTKACGSKIASRSSSGAA
jgi:hypothetical protein